MKSPLVFTAKCYRDLLPSTGAKIGELSVWLGPLTSRGTSAAKISLPILKNWHAVSIGPVYSASLPLVPVLKLLLLYVLGYRTCVQLVFRWFSVVVALLFSCNFDV